MRLLYLIHYFTVCFLFPRGLHTWLTVHIQVYTKQGERTGEQEVLYLQEESDKLFLLRCVDWRPAESLTMPGDSKHKREKREREGLLSMSHCHPYRLHQTRRCIGPDQMIWIDPVCARVCIEAVRMEDSDS